MRILHIEDDTQLQNVIARGFRRAYQGCELTTVDSPDKAIELLSSGSFDIVVSDYNIRGGTGGQVWDWVRSNKPEQLFMFLADDDRIETSGAPYVRKPAKPSDIYHMMDSLLK